MGLLHEQKKQYTPLTLHPFGEEKLVWFRNAKFGMFIHWGLYSILGRGEWVMFNERISVGEYAKLSEQFDATEYAPEQWAKTAKAAGMQYMVLTARHHDGFSLFHTKASDFNSVTSAAGRDLVAEFVEACRNEGLKVGLYYSPMDWRFPGYFFPELYYENALEMKQQCWTQIRELMTNYGKIDILWYDGEWLAHGGIGIKPGTVTEWWLDPNWRRDELYMKTDYFWESESLNRMVRELQPDILINNRSGWEGDFLIREKHIGDMRTDKAWEACDSLGSWGWKPEQTLPTVTEVIHNLIKVVVRDGNFLLNIGPMPTGRMEERYIELVCRVGEWLKQYGETVYGTRGGPFPAGEWGGSTHSANKVFVHVLGGTTDRVVLPNISATLVRWRSYSGTAVHVEHTEEWLTLILPEAAADPVTIIELEFDRQITLEEVTSEEQITVGLADGTVKMTREGEG